jgi:adenine-specific DNA-methyltransferase
MRIREAETTEKLRGGFYSPDPLVDLCWRRISELVKRKQNLTVLEPSIGDGAFVRGLARNESLKRRTASITGIEILPSEAEKARGAMEFVGVDGAVHVQSALKWCIDSSHEIDFDVAVGNPPYLRFQFLSDSDKSAATLLMDRLGIPRSGVANLWIPLLLGSLDRLRVGGAFAFIIPAESFTGISARALRQWLVTRGEAVRFDLFPAGSFPGVLQEVVIVSGKRSRSSEALGRITIEQHGCNGTSSSSAHMVTSSEPTWTKYLLSPDHLEAYDEASALLATKRLGTLARFEVSTVTGANEFFSIAQSTMVKHGLGEWARPLLARIRQAPGLVFETADHEHLVGADLPAFLLHFSADRSKPTRKAIQYISQGIEQELESRYKCRIRDPWYRVPVIEPGTMMLSKRAHFYHRVVLNSAQVITTDTIYRGTALASLAGRESDFVATFHNSLTLLSAEISGRSFGGGVLELVPSEIARLLVLDVPGFGLELERLDRIVRENEATEPDMLVDETDRLLAKADIGLTSSLLDRLHGARLSLAARRFERN